jgi:4-hydroxybenzoate polyprenyltransferase
MVTSLVLVVIGLAGAVLGLANGPVAFVLGSYVAIQLAYTLGLKRIVVVDVLCIASGFVLRLLAGGFAAHVPQSQWILVCTIFLALFLALCKRRHEVVSLGDDAAEHRPILAEYPLPLLDQLISALTAATIVGYTLYTVDERTARVHGLVRDGEVLPWLLLTVPFVVYGLFRYLFLVHRRGGGGSPASTLARDIPSVVNGVLYVAASLLILRFAGHA